MKMRHVMIVAVGLPLLWTAGCTKPSDEDIAEMMRQPARPAELNRLDVMMGAWEAQARINMFDRETNSTGRNTSRWAADQWVMVEEFEHEMGEGNMEKGVMMMWWDDHAKKYRVASATNYGSYGTGTVTYDEKTDKFIWKMKDHSRDGHSMTATGTSKLIDNNTHEWEWSICVPFMGKIMEARGTAKRQ